MVLLYLEGGYVIKLDEISTVDPFAEPSVRTKNRVYLQIPEREIRLYENKGWRKFVRLKTAQEFIVYKRIN